MSGERLSAMGDYYLSFTIDVHEDSHGHWIRLGPRIRKNGFSSSPSLSKPPVTPSGSAVPARDPSPRERDRRDHEGKDGNG